MLKNNKGTLILTSIIILIPMLVGLILWNQFPDQMPIHWNASGGIDGWGSKLFAVVLLPLFLLGIHWFCIIVTATDPKAKDIEGKSLLLVLWVCPFMSVLICALVYATALGIPISVEVILPLMLGAMFMVIGNYIPKCKQNYTIGIKVSWALEDEGNWNATHRFAGKIWVLGGAVIMATSFLESFLILLLVTVIMIALPIIFSYRYHMKTHKGTAD